MAEPRHLILPDGIVSSGWPAVRDTSAQVGILYDPWQQDLNRGMLAKDAEGLYAADTVVLSMCRQSGKTYDVGGVCFADSIIHPGTTTVWTAHRFKVARETFNELKALATSPQMGPHVDPDAITTAAGNECIPFRNGSRILFAARERGAIRGFTKVRRLVLDEAQILTDVAMADLIPTMNQAFNPQVVLMGTPPKPTDPSEVFTSLRQDALEGKTDGVLYCEFSADDDCDLDGWDAVEQANPSFPLRTSKRAVLRLRKLLSSDDDYAREALGIWQAVGLGSVIDPDVWMGSKDTGSKITGTKAFAVDVPPEGGSAVVGVGGFRSDGRPHVEVVEQRSGTRWVYDPDVRKGLVQLAKRHPDAPLVLDPASRAGGILAPLQQALKDAGCKNEVLLVSGRELAAACSRFMDELSEGNLRHLGQPLLTVAADAARKRNVGSDGGWAWHRRDTASDISPLVSVTLALHGAGKPSKKRVRTGKAAFV